MALFWDNTNGRLGVGTNTPNYQLDIVGSASYSTNLYTPLSQGSIPFIGSGGLISQAIQLFFGIVHTTGLALELHRQSIHLT